MIRNSRPLLCAALILPWFAPALLAQKDTILRNEGKPVTKVTLTKLELDKFSYKQGDSDKTMAIELIAGYRFGDAPDTYARGAAAASRGSHAAAAGMFVAAAEAAKSEAVKTAATFYAGRSFALASAKDPSHANNAVAQLQAYLTAEPNGYYLPEAKVRLAQASLAGGDAAGTETMLAALENDPSTGTWPFYWLAQIKFIRAQAQFAQKKYGSARATFQSVDIAISAAQGQNSKYNNELTKLKTEALVLQGETFVEEKLYNDALSYYQTLTSNGSRGVKAAAQAGQGQILYIQGTDKNDEAKLRQAQIALAKACIEPDTSESTSAKALYYMGQVLLALGDKEKNAAARAKTYFTSVKNNYPTTSWANLARKALES